MRISDWSSDVCFSDLADALVEREITADPLDAGEHARPVADQRRALDRRAQLAVLDPVRLGARKHELARDDIDLPAAERAGEDTLLHPAHQLGGIVAAVPHEEIGRAHV